MTCFPNKFSSRNPKDIYTLENRYNPMGFHLKRNPKDFHFNDPKTNPYLFPFGG